MAGVALEPAAPSFGKQPRCRRCRQVSALPYSAPSANGVHSWSFAHSASSSAAQA
jgi:hypothetical protein